MKNRIELIEEIIEQAKKLAYGDNNLDLVVKRTEMMIRKLFGDNSHYINTLKLIRYHPMMYTLDSPDSVFRRSFNSGKLELLNLLDVIKEDVSLDITLNPNTTILDKDMNPLNSNVFIVHGHNEEMKLSVALTIKKLGLNPIILHEQPNKGRTIIEKFTENSDVLYAIVILSADDIAYLSTDSPKKAKFRARQNVIFELGFFIGKLGREKVLALHQVVEKFEIPSDYTGVIFVPFDDKGTWKFELTKELKAIGIDVDANKIL
jgi:predicted nucleotide-binding protein